MSFREKSAWVMAAILAGAGAFYLWVVIGAWQASGAAPHPLAVLPAVFIIIVASIVAQVVLALTNVKAAQAPADERERPIIDRAGSWSGMVLAFGTVSALIWYIGHGDGNLLFHSVMASLFVSSTAEYGLEIAMLRRA